MVYKRVGKPFHHAVGKRPSSSPRQVYRLDEFVEHHFVGYTAPRPGLGRHHARCLPGKICHGGRVAYEARSARSPFSGGKVLRRAQSVRSGCIPQPETPRATFSGASMTQRWNAFAPPDDELVFVLQPFLNLFDVLTGKPGTIRSTNVAYTPHAPSNHAAKSSPSCQRSRYCRMILSDDARSGKSTRREK